MTDKTQAKSANENAKVDDTEIQGKKGGERNRKSKDEGVMPPPAGESKSVGRDPRT